MDYHLTKDEELRRINIKLKEEIDTLEFNKKKIVGYKKIVTNGIANVKLYKDKLAINAMVMRKLNNRIKELSKGSK